ncbi:MAG: RluA family pseudouridine synthase [Thermoanaerobaculales bacterium]
METSRILYADARMVALDKPAGVSLATRRDEPGAAVRRLLDEVSLAERTEWGLHAEDLLLVHRLDVGTSGLVLLARDRETHRELVAAFAERRVSKSYLALVWGHPRPPAGSWEAPLGPDRHDRRRMAVNGAGRRAITAYTTLARAAHVALLCVQPATGRTHQIRVHAAHAGHPIVGDDLYAGPRERGVRDTHLRAALSPPHTLLHAWRLHLPHTRSTPELLLEAPLPAIFTATLAACGITLPDTG